jgi:hypothetical protein
LIMTAVSYTVSVICSFHLFVILIFMLRWILKHACSDVIFCSMLLCCICEFWLAVVISYISSLLVDCYGFFWAWVFCFTTGDFLTGNVYNVTLYLLLQLHAHVVCSYYSQAVGWCIQSFCRSCVQLLATD